MNKRLRKISRWLHLWLGLTSGIVVFIVSLTGALQAFQQEIKDALEPWRFVDARDQAFVPPSRLVDTAGVYVPGVEPGGLTYEDEEGAAAVGLWSEEDGKQVFSVVFMNPYTAEFIKKQEPGKKGNFDFFSFIMDGHRALWLPYEIGSKIVGIGTLFFLLLLITGLILWWPRRLNKRSLKRSLKVKWTAKPKKLKYDLHNVLGFYVLLLGLVFAITGLVWSFDWFGDAFYYATSGGETRPEHVHPHSDASKAYLADNDSVSAIDRAWYRTMEQEPDPQRIYMNPTLKEDDDAIEIIVSQIKGKYYKSNEYFYDRYTLEPIRVKGDRYEEADFADKLARMNYDIHTGAILGLPGKILAFFVSLIIASLPVTGVMMWVNKSKGTQKRKPGWHK